VVVTTATPGGTVLIWCLFGSHACCRGVSELGAEMLIASSMGPRHTCTLCFAQYSLIRAKSSFPIWWACTRGGTGPMVGASGTNSLSATHAAHWSTRVISSRARSQRVDWQCCAKKGGVSCLTDSYDHSCLHSWCSASATYRFRLPRQLKKRNNSLGALRLESGCWDFKSVFRHWRKNSPTTYQHRSDRRLIFKVSTVLTSGSWLA